MINIMELFSQIIDNPADVISITLEDCCIARIACKNKEKIWVSSEDVRHKMISDMWANFKNKYHYDILHLVISGTLDPIHVLYKQCYHANALKNIILTDKTLIPTSKLLNMRIGERWPLHKSVNIFCTTMYHMCDNHHYGYESHSTATNNIKKIRSISDANQRAYNMWAHGIHH